ncbi:LOW QUALITY PROTEIN: hypothetical protein PHPALM_27558 [Phytophthora palmivora]|uniref:Uncharacterized protein n=1 Tax=Phytophthora palmivora TaxID=4796 RepID=A0A2P4XCB8_9STRA|nr:LOW QUALITY PROTEIN: hypothetical protein PHPALM_27558 [Phytophthora palmivora]
MLIYSSRSRATGSFRPGRRTPPQQKPPKNHNSARLIRQGQANGTYLVVGLSLLHQWKNINCSPFGAVEKKGIPTSKFVRYMIFPFPTQSLQMRTWMWVAYLKLSFYAW